MSRQGKQASVADRAVLLVSAPKSVFLDVGHTLHKKANGVKNDAGNVSSSAEGRLRELRDVWRVENRDWQRTGPYPKHLARIC